MEKGEGIVSSSVPTLLLGTAFPSSREKQDSTDKLQHSLHSTLSNICKELLNQT